MQSSGLILVAEDDAELADVISDLLDDEGYRVTRVRDGLAVLSAVEQERPELVLLDGMLPGIDGFEVCRRLRAREGRAHVPVLMLTALSEAQHRVRGIRAGADDYLTKPYDADELLLRIALRIDQARRESEQRQMAVRAGLQAIGHAVATPETLGDLVQRVVDLTGMILDGSACAILLWDAALNCFWPAGSAGLSDAQQRIFDALRMPLGRLDSVDALAARGHPFLVQHGDNPLSTAVLEVFGQATALVTPLIYRETLYGMLVIARNSQSEPFADADSELLSSLAGQTALALANRRAAEQLERLAVTDYLTGLYNPRYFHEFLTQQLARARRTGEPTSLLMIDLDHFKRINDTYGHPAGDKVLATVASLLRSSVREADVPARYGGEEFAAVLPNADRLQALDVAERILNALRATRIDTGDAIVSVTASIGVAGAGSEAQPQALIQQADRALYLAKRAGRDRVRWLAPVGSDNRRRGTLKPA